jgi:hypothetical protein
LCVASNIRAMPENEKPPARRVDVYCYAYDKKMSDGHFLVDFYNNIN